MDAIAIIDGTGRFFDSAYASDMANSFCSQMDRALSKNPAYQALYIRGPSDDGLLVPVKAQEAAVFAATAKQKGAERIFLAGYSRGGDVAFMAAQRLACANIPVDGLFLFDPVEQFPSEKSVKNEVLPNNVRFSRVASRDLTSSLVGQYKAKLLQKPYNGLPLATPGNVALIKKLGGGDNVPFTDMPWLGNPIRPEFGRYNIGICHICDHEAKTFVGSHGALGGVGWYDVTGDGGYQDAVARWFNEAFRACKLDVAISSFAPTAKFPKS